MRQRRFLAITAASLMVLARTHAQVPQPTYNVEVDAIDVDVVVTDDQGRHVAGLTVADFELFEDGQPQTIQTFSHVNIPSTAPSRFSGAPAPATSDARSNREPASGRMYLIVLDDLNISPLRVTDVRKTARAFIESYFGAGDVAAVVYTSGRVDASQDLTSDALLLLASIDKFMGRGVRSTALEAADKYYEDRLTLAIDPPDGVKPENIPQLAADMQDSRGRTLGNSAKPTVDIGDFERAQRVITVLDSVRTLAESLSPLRGRRKAVVMFSEGLNYQLAEPFGMRSVSDVLRATRDTLTAAARANVSFYTIDPRGLDGAGTDFMQMIGSGMPNGGTQAAIIDEFRRTQDSLRVLAEETGGFASLNSNSFASAFDRIVERNSHYYLLGYAPPDHPADGQFHQIDVRVRRPGLKVVARRGYASPNAGTIEQQKRDEVARRAREARRPEGDAISAELRSVLDSAIQQTGFGLSVHAAPFRGTNKEASVALTIELDGERLPLTPGGKVELSFYDVNDQGKAGTGVRKEIDLAALKRETSQRVRMHGLRLNPRIALAPGRYRLRFAARETNGGRSGSVFYDLLVPDFGKEPLAMSGLLLTSASAQRMPTAEPDRVAARLLDGAATSRREFPVDDKLAVFAELYDNEPSQQRRQIDVAVRLIAEDGVEVFIAKDSVAGERPRIHAELALKDLEPGPYLLRVEAQPRGTALSVIARETLIDVTRPVVPEAASVDQLLDRATVYVADFVAKLSRVVAEEQYVQEYLDAGVEGSRASFLASPKVRDRRTLTSDLLLVRPSESDDWFVFRDVFDVDGRAVRDRENRLTKLFLDSRDTATALQRAAQIAADSARFNIRQIGTVDHPLLALGFLQASYRERFRFTIRGPDASVGRDVWIMEFRETARPTIIRASGDKDIFARGRYWIEGASGRVARTEVVFNALGTESTVTTAFELDDRLGTSVPVEMRFKRGASLNEVRGIATYRRFRRFEVGTQEQMQK